MRLLLVRHAEAHPLALDGISSDFHRKLTDHGHFQAQALAEAIKHRVLNVTTIISSPLVRAIETAEALVNVLTPGQEMIVTERLASGEMKPKKLSRLVLETGGFPVLVGHMPDLAHYAGWLTGGTETTIDFEKAAVACINCRHAIEKGAGSLEWLIPPAWFMPPQSS